MHKIEYITPAQLSEMWGISPSTLRKWRWEGKGPQFVKFGSRVMYRLIDIEAYENAHIRHSTSDTGGMLPA